jgi:hypothetical protein
MAGSVGKADRARHYLDTADRSADIRNSRREHAVNTLARAELAVALDSRAEARGHLDRAAEAFEKMHMQWHLQRARSLYVAL